MYPRATPRGNCSHLRLFPFFRHPARGRGEMSTGTDLRGKTRAQELAERFDTDNGVVIGFVQAASDDQWNRVTTAEGWTVAATAMHIATGHLIIPPWVHRI